MEQSTREFEKFKSLIEDIKFAMLITSGMDGKNSGRPMTTAKVDDDGTLWFFTNEHTSQVDEVYADKDVYLSYASPAANSYVGVNGIASLVDDAATIEALWKPIYKVWFPEGLDDPNILLLKVVPDQVEYWNGPNKVVMAAKMLKAYLAGTEFQGGEHQKL